MGSSPNFTVSPLNLYNLCSKPYCVHFPDSKAVSRTGLWATYWWSGHCHWPPTWQTGRRRERERERETTWRQSYGALCQSVSQSLLSSSYKRRKSVRREERIPDHKIQLRLGFSIMHPHVCVKVNFACGYHNFCLILIIFSSAWLYRYVKKVEG